LTCRVQPQLRSRIAGSFRCAGSVVDMSGSAPAQVAHCGFLPVCRVGGRVVWVSAPAQVAHGGFPSGTGRVVGGMGVSPSSDRACVNLPLSTRMGSLSNLRNVWSRWVVQLPPHRRASIPMGSAHGQVSRLPIVPAIASERYFVPNVGNKSVSIVTGCSFDTAMRRCRKKVSREGIVLPVSSRVFTFCALRH